MGCYVSKVGNYFQEHRDESIQSARRRTAGARELSSEERVIGAMNNRV